jgi:hypothetical protein
MLYSLMPIAVLWQRLALFYRPGQALGNERQTRRLGGSEANGKDAVEALDARGGFRVEVEVAADEDVGVAVTRLDAKADLAIAAVFAGKKCREAADGAHILDLDLKLEARTLREPVEGLGAADGHAGRLFARPAVELDLQQRAAAGASQFLHLLGDDIIEHRRDELP